jgi:hypothetical protein
MTLKGYRNHQPRLKAGEWVEVLSKDAILATLDANGRLDELPFMPEMFDYCGRRFRVWKRAHKTCDTVNKTGGRRIAAAVHLADVRCDGAGHGGCQAACLIFWKEAWLQRVPDEKSLPRQAKDVVRHSVMSCGAPTEQRIWSLARANGDEDIDAIYACQATLLPQASTLLPWWDFRQYIEDYTSGNASAGQLLSGAIYVSFEWLARVVRRRSSRAAAALIHLYDQFQTLIGGVPYPRRWGTIPAGQKTPTRPLHLTAGDLVQVRPYPEILSTLDTNNRNRGMYFDAEEVPYCGKTLRVRSSVTRIIDEKTGKMLTLKDNNVILEGAICQARYSDRRMICPRAIYSIWRETWLTRADGHSQEP